MVKKITKSDLPPIPSIDRMANKINENFESIEGGRRNSERRCRWRFDRDLS